MANESVEWHLIEEGEIVFSSEEILDCLNKRGSEDQKIKSENSSSS